MHFRISKSAQKFFDNIINFSGSHGVEDKNKFIDEYIIGENEILFCGADFPQ